MQIAKDKAVLRKNIRAQINKMNESEKRMSDKVMFDCFLLHPIIEKAETVLLYYGVGGEPDTRVLFDKLIKMGKQVLLPRCMPENQMEARIFTHNTKLIPNEYGILEPSVDATLIGNEKIDLILCPCLACDENCNRLGQAGGYYDRYLQNYRGVTVAFCRDKLLLSRVPTEEHDIPMSYVITETKVLVQNKSND